MAGSNTSRKGFIGSSIPRKVIHGIGKTFRKLKPTKILKRSNTGFGTIDGDNDERHDAETKYMNNLRGEIGDPSGSAPGDYLSLPLDPIESDTRTNVTAILNSNPNLSRTNANFIYPVERYLRLTCIIVGAFYAGAFCGSSVLLVTFKVLEYAVVAWLTSVLILFVLRMNNASSENLQNSTHTFDRRSFVRSVGTYITGPNDDFSETIDTFNNTTSDAGTPLLDSPNRSISSPPKVVTSDPKNTIEGVRTFNGQHPETQKLHIITSDGLSERIIPNTIVRYESDMCVGNIMMMIRTPDADVEKKPPHKYGMNDLALKVSDYFRPKQRRFVCQFQVKLKEIPQGEIYMGVEFDNPIKMGIIQRALAHAGLGFIKKTNRGFHFSLTGGDGTNHHFPSAEYLEKGEYELPHMAFPIVGCMDTMIVTKPGEPLPALGGDLYERPESIKARKKGGMGDFTGWNTEDTYTLVVYSAYIDWLKWKCVNLPGIRPFSLCALCGDQAVNLTTYVHEGDDDPREPHFVKDKRYISSVEFSSVGKSTGKTIKKWMSLTEAESAIQRSENGFAMGETENIDNLENAKNESDEDIDEADIDDDDDDDDDDENGDAEAEGEEDDVIEDLGGGMYLRCGDPIVLRDASEAIQQENADTEKEKSYVTNSFGFAVMQGQSPSSIIFEKASASRQDRGRRNRSKSKLIRSGDTVLIKILTDKQEYKYLTLFKGWWLKWVTHVPKKNGYFKVFTNGCEGDEDIHDTTRSIELQSTYLSLGASFSLRHRRWPSFEIGVGIDRSTKFGGRVLGLHRWRGLDDNQIPREKSKFKSLRFSAHNAISLLKENPSKNESSEHLLSINMKNIKLDASAWIEMMHRTMRTRQRVYIVRMKHDDINSKNLDAKNAISDLSSSSHSKMKRILDDSMDNDILTDGNSSLKCTMRLRTGQDLAPLLQMGRSYNISNVIASSIMREAGEEDEAKTNDFGNDDELDDVNDVHDYEEQLSEIEFDSDSDEEIQLNRSLQGITNAGSIDSVSSYLQSDIPTMSFSNLNETNEKEKVSENEIENLILNANNTDLNEDNQTDDDNVAEDFVVCEEANVSPRIMGERKKKKKWMNTTKRVAKSVKYGTTKTSKQVVKQTVNAGRFISKGIVHKKKKKRQPTRKEPRIRTPKHTRDRRKKKWRDHYVAVNKVMKNYSPSSTAGRILAGQMTAPDQSLRIVSHFLSEMTSDFVPLATQTKFTPIFSSKFNPPSELDTWFLSGDAADLGVTQSKNEGILLEEFVVARCLWESHWREEWCGIYEDHISFYATCSKKALFSTMFSDILKIRMLDLPDERNPLPGLCFLVIETVWRCHYLAFNFCKTRNSCFQSIKSSIAPHASEDLQNVTNIKHGNRDRSKDSWISSDWTNVHALDASILSDGRGKWARVSSSKKSKKRIVLNNRRMSFDTKLFQSSLTSNNSNEQMKKSRDHSMAKFSCKLLHEALSLSFKTMEKNMEGFIRFLDMTSRLRCMPLHLLDLSSKEAFCIFVNIYHCLLQHTLLLQGTPDKRSIGHFMRCNCYEIGGDVFSLAELECLVLRGELTKSVHPKPPFVNAPKASKAYHIYSLGRVDPRLNFVLNNGSSSNLSRVPIFSPLKLDEQIDHVCVKRLQNDAIVDRKKQSLLLPKVCDIYRNDFGDGDSMHCLSFCIRFLKEEDQRLVIDLLNTGFRGYTIKFYSPTDTFHSYLIRMDDPIFST